MNLTAEEARELFFYNSLDGSLEWKKRRVGVRKDMKVASIDTHGYLQVKINGRTYQAHRVVFLMFNMRWPKNQIDHINGCRTDNRIENLREVTCQENRRNSKLRCDNKSGYSGIHWIERDKKWSARIRIGGKLCQLGYFVKKDDAIAARKSAEKELGFHENHGRKR